MRKKILFLLMFSILIVLPFDTHADCKNCGGAGGGTGNGSTYQGGGCTLGNCTKSSTGGVRITLYSYTGSGTPTKIGNSVDIFASNFYTPAVVTSPKKSDVLKDRNKNSCNIGHSGYSLSGYTTYSWKEYKKNFTYFVEVIQDDIDKGNIADWLYNMENDTGWLKGKVFTPMINGDFAKVAELFGTTEAKVKDNSENLYITAELMTQIILTPGSSDIYTGTVSEISTNVIFTDFINHMYINNKYYDNAAEVAEKKGFTEPFGKLVGKSNSSKYLTAASGNGFHPELKGDNRFTTGKKGELCGKPYGMAVWYLAVCCPDCVKSCDSECKDYSKGTTERQACAMKYCDENPTNGETSATCVSKCVGEINDKGCDETNQDGPYKYCNASKPVTNYKDSDVCDENQKCGSGQTIVSNVCYDEESELEIPGEVISNTDAKDLGFKYYRIECDETLKMANGVDITKVLQFKDRASDLHIGISATFEKTCELKFKKRKKENGKYVYEWISAAGKWKDTNAMITADINTYTTYKNKATGTLKNDYEKIVKKLEEIYDRAYKRLSYVTELDTGKVSTTTKVEVINKSMTDVTEVTMELKPLYCQNSSSMVIDKTKTSLKCVLEKSTVYKQSDNSIICGNDGEAIIDVNTTNKGTAKYQYTVHYVTDSTWNSSYGDPNKVYVGSDGQSGQSKCLTAVNTFNGYCTEIKNAYRLEPFEESVKTTTTQIKTKGNYEIFISGYGSCGQIKYGCCASYELVDGNLCNKCMDLDPTTQAYKDCYKANCSCDKICGSNVACRAQYCPLECEGCLEEYIDESSTREICDDCVEKCNADIPTTGGSAINENISQNIVCRFDCCNNSCDIGNDTCRYDCCLTKCNRLKEKNLLEYMGYKATNSMTALESCYYQCKCPNGNCGNDYYYRTINQDEPFPKREPGSNWFNKVEFITKSADKNDRYYDNTNGRDETFEYRITLTADDVKKIRDDNKINTTYTQKKSSTTMQNLDDKGVYCSYMLHDYLNNDLNITIEAGVNEVFGSGCKYKG